MMATLVDAETGHVLVSRLTVADTFLSRSVGLLGKSSLASDEAMLIRPCASIHTFFMRMELNVAFCDAQGIVIDVRSGIRPWRMRFGPRGSHFVLEWSPEAGELVRVGQQVCVQ